MSYPLEALLNIRENKYEKAKSLKLVLLKALENATSNIQLCQKDIDEYIIQKEQEINKNYDLIINQILSRQDLDLFFDKINEINDKELYLLDKLKDAKNKKSILQEQYNKAIEDLSLAQKSFYKLKEHKNNYLLEVKRIKEQEEENDSYEFVEFKYQKR